MVKLTLTCYVVTCMLLICGQVKCDNILFLGGVPSASHHIWNTALILSLTENGHNVTVLTLENEESDVGLYYITMEGVYEAITNEWIGTNGVNLVKKSTYSIIKETYDYNSFVSSKLVETNGFKQLLNYPDNFKFSLIIHDFTSAQVLLGFVKKFNSPPLVSVSAFGTPPHIYAVSGTPNLPSYNPHYATVFTKNMGYFERFENTMNYVFDWIYRRYFYMPHENRLARDNFGFEITLENVEQNSSLVLINSDSVLDYATSYPPHVRTVAGLHTKEVVGISENVSPHLLKKFSSILQNMGQLLECPICFDTVKPPVYQCCNGHILCQPCRTRSSKCPICRVQLGRRGRCLIADHLYDQLMEEKQKSSDISNSAVSDKKMLSTNNSEQQIIALTSRTQPLRPTNYCSIFKEIFMRKRKELIINENLDHQATFAKKFFESSDSNNEQDYRNHDDDDNNCHIEERETINCPTGKSCKLMHTRDELFIHLLRSHQLPVTHYYCYPRDVVKIKFTERAISCVTINGGKSISNHPVSKPQSCQFFIIKYLKYPNEKICWIWYLGRMLDELKYRVKLKNRESNINFILNPIPISLDVHDVLKLKEYIFIKDNCKHLNIQILIDK